MSNYSILVVVLALISTVCVESQAVDYLGIEISNNESPCSSSGTLYQLIANAANALYNNRAHEHYTEDMTKRWSGISSRICPPNAPPYSDCSSAVTWIWWTAIGMLTIIAFSTLCSLHLALCARVSLVYSFACRFSPSSFALWLGKGADILNGESWEAGYTGTLYVLSFRVFRFAFHRGSWLLCRLLSMLSSLNPMSTD